MKKNLIWILYDLFVVIGISLFEFVFWLKSIDLPWWGHGLGLLLSLWLAGGVGAIGEPESPWEPDGHP